MYMWEAWNLRYDLRYGQGKIWDLEMREDLRFDIRKGFKSILYEIWDLTLRSAHHCRLISTEQGVSASAFNALMPLLSVRSGIRPVKILASAVAISAAKMKRQVYVASWKHGSCKEHRASQEFSRMVVDSQSGVGKALKYERQMEGVCTRVHYYTVSSTTARPGLRSSVSTDYVTHCQQHDSTSWTMLGSVNWLRHTLSAARQHVLDYAWQCQPTTSHTVSSTTARPGLRSAVSTDYVVPLLRTLSYASPVVWNYFQ